MLYFLKRTVANAIMCNFLALVSVMAYGQDLNSKYAIVSFERVRKNDIHASVTYFWTISISPSSKPSQIELYPFYLYGYSKNNLNRCCLNEITAIHQMSVGTQLLDSSYKTSMESLRDIILSKRRKVQTIKKNWADGRQEVINIYLTPVIGQFCKCSLDKEDGKAFSYQGPIVVPKEDVHYYSEFWNNTSEIELLPTDYYNKIIETGYF